MHLHDGVPDLPRGPAAEPRRVVEDQAASDTRAPPHADDRRVGLGRAELELRAHGDVHVVAEEHRRAERIREIGVRVALGASRADILRLMTWQGLRPIVAGVALGAIGALGATRALESALVGVGARDPFTFVGVAAVLLVVGTLASLIPARRALRVQPTRALQE